MLSIKDKGSSPAPLVVSERQAAAMTGLGYRTLQAMRLSGNGPAFVQLSKRRVGYSVAELERWISERSVQSTADATVRSQKGRPAC